MNIYPQDELITPAQFNDLCHRRSDVTPEIRLARAVLEDGLRCYSQVQPNDPSASGYALRLRREAELWILSNAQGPFSFLWCCEVLEEDAEQCRRRLPIVSGGLPRYRHMVDHPNRVVSRKEQ